MKSNKLNAIETRKLIVLEGKLNLHQNLRSWWCACRKSPVRLQNSSPSPFEPSSKPLLNLLKTLVENPFKWQRISIWNRQLGLMII